MKKQQKEHKRSGAESVAIIGLLVGMAIFGACKNEAPAQQLDSPAPTTSLVVPTIPARATCTPTPKPNTPTPAPTPEPVKEERVLDPAEVEYIGRTIWGEADGVKSEAERAAVAWCILNRVDARGQTIEEVVTAPRQFHGYRPADKWGDCPQRHLDLAADVMARWYAEKDGAEDVGRVLPAEYLFFVGDGERNHFSIEWQGTDFWNWSLDDPYILTK